MFTWLKTVCRGLAASFLPSLRKAGTAAKRSWGFYVFLHVLGIVVIFILLTFLQRILLPNLSWASPVAPYWLAILFLLLYFPVWVGNWLWTLLVSQEELSTYPDIDAAWHEVMLTLARKRLDLGDLPLFLILGQSAGGAKALFQAAKINLRMDQTPSQEDVPLHAYASEQAIFVTCPGLSLLAHQARNLARSMDWLEIHKWAPTDDPERSSMDTLAPGEEAPSLVRDVALKARQAAREGKSMDDVLDDKERQTLFEAERKERKVLSLLHNPEAVEECLARLRHLCQLIARDRDPLCPANGILLLVPYAATGSEQFASDTAELCKRDLETVRKGFQLLCPRIALLCDMELAPGFREFISRFPKDKRLSRMGQGCPLAPDFIQASSTLGPEPLAKSLASWVCRETLPTFLHTQFSLEEEPDGFTSCLNRNVQLYALLNQLRERERFLGQLLARGLVKGVPDPLLFGGCYVAATGSESPDQAFVRGIMEWLREHQDDVRWIEEVFQQEKKIQLWTGYCYTAVVCLLGLSVAVLLIALVRSFSSG